MNLKSLLENLLRPSLVAHADGPDDPRITHWQTVGDTQYGLDAANKPVPGATKPAGAGVKDVAPYALPALPGLIADNQAGKYKKQNGELATDAEVAAASAASRTTNSNSNSTSNSTSTQISDPRQLEINQRQVDAAIDIAKKNYDLAVRTNDDANKKFWQDHLDKLQTQATDIAWAREQLGIQQTFTGEQNQANRDVTTSEGAANRAVTTNEGAAGRSLTSYESAADRAQRAAEFAITSGLNYDQYVLAVEQQNAQAKAKNLEDQLSAAQQYSQVVSQVDPAAYTAYIQGLGNTALSRPSNGVGALSERALLPAARTLSTIDKLKAGPDLIAIQPRSVYTPPQIPAWQEPTPLVPAAGTVVSPVKPAPAPAPVNGGATGTAQAQGSLAAAGGSSAAGAAATGNIASGLVAAGVSPAAAASMAAAVANSNAAAAANAGTTFAEGTPDWIPAPPNSILGDSPTGQATGNEELLQVADPPGPNNAEMKVTPNASHSPNGISLARPGAQVGGMDDGSDMASGDIYDQMGVGYASGRRDADKAAGLGSLARPMPGGPPAFAEGTVVNAGDPYNAQELGTADDVTIDDLPYMEKVAALRRNVDIPDISPQQANFYYLDPLIRSRYFAGRQDKFGIPVASQDAAASQLRLQGLSRDSVQTRY